MARRNQACGVISAIRPRSSGAWLSGMKTPPIAAMLRATIAFSPPACSTVLASVETRVEMPVAAMTAATSRTASRTGGPQLAWTSSGRGDHEGRHRHQAEDHPRERATEDDGRRRTRARRGAG